MGRVTRRRRAEAGGSPEWPEFHPHTWSGRRHAVFPWLAAAARRHHATDGCDARQGRTLLRAMFVKHVRISTNLGRVWRGAGWAFLQMHSQVAFEAVSTHVRPSSTSFGLDLKRREFELRGGVCFLYRYRYSRLDHRGCARMSVVCVHCIDARGVAGSHCVLNTAVNRTLPFRVRKSSLVKFADRFEQSPFILVLCNCTLVC